MTHIGHAWMTSQHACIRIWYCSCSYRRGFVSNAWIRTAKDFIGTNSRIRRRLALANNRGGVADDAYLFPYGKSPREIYQGVRHSQITHAHHVTIYSHISIYHSTSDTHTSHISPLSTTQCSSLLLVVTRWWILQGRHCMKVACDINIIILFLCCRFVWHLAAPCNSYRRRGCFTFLWYRPGSTRFGSPPVRFTV